MKSSEKVRGSFWASDDEKAVALRWLMGLSGTWIILTLMVDLGDTSDLAVALALVIMGSVLLEYGPDVFKSLGISTTDPAAGGVPARQPVDSGNNSWAPVSGARILEV
jgi:hypothetical protein